MANIPEERIHSGLDVISGPKFPETNGLLPAAAQSTIKFHYASQFIAPQACQRELALKQVALNVEDLQVAVEAAFVANLRELVSILQRIDIQCLLLALLKILLMIDKRVRYLAKTILNGLSVGDHHFTLGGFRVVDVVAKPPGIEDCEI